MGSAAGWTGTCCVGPGYSTRIRWVVACATGDVAAAVAVGASAGVENKLALRTTRTVHRGGRASIVGTLHRFCRSERRIGDYIECLFKKNVTQKLQNEYHVMV